MTTLTAESVPAIVEDPLIRTFVTQMMGNVRAREALEDKTVIFVGKVTMVFPTVLGADAILQESSQFRENHLEIALHPTL